MRLMIGPNDMMENAIKEPRQADIVRIELDLPPRECSPNARGHYSKRARAAGASIHDRPQASARRVDTRGHRIMGRNGPPPPPPPAPENETTTGGRVSHLVNVNVALPTVRLANVCRIDGDRSIRWGDMVYWPDDEIAGVCERIREESGSIRFDLAVLKPWRCWECRQRVRGGGYCASCGARRPSKGELWMTRVGVAGMALAGVLGLAVVVCWWINGRIG